MFKALTPYIISYVTTIFVKVQTTHSYLLLLKNLEKNQNISIKKVFSDYTPLRNTSFTGAQHLESLLKLYAYALYNHR